MNKKIILYSFAVLAIQTVAYGAYGAVVPTAAVNSAIAVAKGAMTNNVSKVISAGAASGSAVSPSMPKIQLDDTQMKAFTAGIGTPNVKQYWPQVMTLWQTNNPIFYDAVQAFRDTNREAQNYALKALENKAKELASKQSTEFNVQDAVMQNTRLKNIVSQELPSDFASIRKNMGNIAYNLGNESSSNKDAFYALNKVLPVLETEITSLLSNQALTPQDAASKLSTLIDRVSHEIGQSNIINFTNPTLQSNISATTEKLTDIKELLETAKSQLQKARPGQPKIPSRMEVENWVKSINAPESKTSLPESSSELQSLETQGALKVIPMPAKITQFFNQKTSLLETNLTQVTKDCVALKKQISDLRLEYTKNKVLTIQINSILSDITIIKNLQDTLKTLHNHPDALVQINLISSKISLITSEIINSLQTLTLEIKDLSLADQRAILENLQKIVNGVERINLEAQTTALVLNEFNAQKEVIAQVAKDMDLANYVLQTQKDLATVQTTAKNLAKILLSSGDIITTDEAPMSMVEVFERQLETYLTTFQEVTTIKDITELQSIDTKLKSQEKELIQNLNRIFKKIVSLPTSTRKNDALDLWRNLKGQFTANNKAVDNFFEKAFELEEKHMFVLAKKDLLVMRLSLIKDKVEIFGKDIAIIVRNPTADQQLALSKLNDMLAQIRSDIKQLEAAKTSLELDQLTTEFFKAGKLADLAKKPSALVPVGETALAFPKYEKTLNETLKLFGLKLVLGVGTAGTVTWLAEKAMGDETVEPVSKVDDTFTTIITPTTEAEFRQESEKVLNMIQGLKYIPLNKLKDAIQHINASIKALNLKDFQEAGKAFIRNLIEKIKALYNDAVTSLNDVRAKIIKIWLDKMEKSNEMFLELNQIKPNIPKRPSYKSNFDEIQEILNKWINRK